MFNQGGYSLADIAAATNKNNGNCGYGNGFMGDGAWWIIILFLFVFCGWNNNGFGNGNEGGALTRADLCQDMNFQGVENGVRGIQQGLCDGFYAQNTNTLNGFAGVQNALTNGFAGVDNAVCTLGYQTQQGINSINMANMQNTNAIQTQISGCCCDTRAAIKDVQFQNAQDTCTVTNTIQNTTRDMIDNTNAGIRAILDKMCQQEIEAKNAQIAAQNQKIFGLELAASQAAQNTYLINQLAPKFPVPSYQVCNPFTGQYGYPQNNGYGCGCNCNNYCNG